MADSEPIFVRQKQIKGAGRHVTLYWDDVLNLKVGVEVDAPIAGEGEILASATPAGPEAAAVHFGPYNRLVEAHLAIRKWCDDHQDALAGPSWEIYGHWMDDWKNNPSRIRTNVYYLIGEKNGRSQFHK